MTSLASANALRYGSSAVSKLMLGTKQAWPYVAPAYGARVLEDAPWGHWRQTEASGTTLADASGNGRHMTITGAPTLNQAGPKGKAIAWPADVNVFARTAIGFSAPSAWTFEGWVYLTANPAQQIDVLALGDSQSGAPYNNSALYVSAAGKVGYYWYSGGANIVESSSSLSLNTWHHLVAKIAPGAQSLRVDKTVWGSSALGGTTGLTNTVWTHSGWNAGNGAARIAEPAIYPSALSDARADIHYDAGIG